METKHLKSIILQSPHTICLNTPSLHNAGCLFSAVVPTFVSAGSVTNTAITTNITSSRASTIQTSFTTTPLVESTRKIAQIDSDSSGFSLVTSIVIPLVLLAVLLGVFILLLLVRSGTFLSKSSHPWIIAVRRSTGPKNMPDPRNQFCNNHDGTDRVDQSPTVELRNPGLYSAVEPGHGNPTNRLQTHSGIAAALYDSCTENEKYMYATCDGAAPRSYVNTETKQKDAGEPYASVQSKFDQPAQDVQSNPVNKETQASGCEESSAPTVRYSVPRKGNTTDVRRHYEKAEQCTATKRVETPSTTNSIKHIGGTTDVTSLSILSKSAESCVQNQEKCIDPDDVERKQRRGLSDATPVVCRDTTTTITSTNPLSSSLSLPATSIQAESDTQRCMSPSQVPKPLPFRVFKVLKDSQGDYMKSQDTVSNQPSP